MGDTYFTVHYAPVFNRERFIGVDSAIARGVVMDLMKFATESHDLLNYGMTALIMIFDTVCNVVRVYCLCSLIVIHCYVMISISCTHHIHIRMVLAIKPEHTTKRSSTQDFFQMLNVSSKQKLKINSQIPSA